MSFQSQKLMYTRSMKGSLLDAVYKNKPKEIVLEIIKEGNYNPYEVDKYGNNALMYASARYDSSDVALALINTINTGKYKPESRPEQINNYGETALILAIENQLPDVALALIKTGMFEVGHVDNKLNTALIYACMIKMTDVANELIKTGKSNPQQVTKSGITAYDIAVENNMIDFVDIPNTYTNNLQPLFRGMKEQDIMKLPKYINSCQGNYCDEKMIKLENYILNKYCDKNNENKEIAFMNAFNYSRHWKNQNMCKSERSQLEIGGGLDYMRKPGISFFFIMDKERKVPHTIIFFHYLKEKNMLYIDLFCVNQIEEGSGGYITLNILKKACKHAGITNILLDSVPGAIEFYQRQDFVSVIPGINLMKLNKSLSPLKSPKKENSMNSVTSRRIATRKRKNLFDLTQDGGMKTNKTRKWKSLPREISSSKSNTSGIFENKDYTPIDNEKMKKFISNIHDTKNHIQKNNKQRTLIDLSNDKEYVVFHNELYVNE